MNGAGEVPLRYLVGPLGRGAGRASFIVPLGIETPLAQAPAEPGGDGPRTSRACFDEIL
jgi:hypothetical protein